MIGSWRERAACRGTDPELYALATLQELAAARGRRGARAQVRQIPRIARALAVCGRCPVVEECRAEAIGSVDLAVCGVWGGEYVTYREACGRLAAARAAARVVGEVAA